MNGDCRRIVYNGLFMEPVENHSDSDAASNPARRRIMTLLKLSVTVVGLYLVLSKLDLEAILAVMKGVNLLWMVAGAVLIALSLPLRAYRWHIVLHGAGSSIRFRRLVELYLVGSFFNAFLPSGVGGDVVRAAEAAQDVDSSVAVSSVLIDRLTGLMAIFIMALILLPFMPVGFPGNLAVTIGAICILGLVLGVVLVDGRLFQWVARFLPRGIRTLGDGFLDRFARSMSACSRRSLIAALIISVVFNVMQIGWWLATGRAIGLDIPFSYYVLVVPVLALALLVPSIGGLGVRENLAPILFSGAGISAEQAVALTLLVFGLERVASLLGAPVYLGSIIRNARNQPKPDRAINS